MSQKHKDLMSKIEDFDQRDLPEGHALVYVGDDFVDLLTNAIDGKQAADLIIATMKVATNLILDIISNTPKEGSIQETTEYFTDLFKTVLFEGIAMDEDIFVSYLEELTRLIKEQEEEKVSPIEIKTEKYN